MNGTNLYDETVNVLARHGKTIQDIAWIGIYNTCTFDVDAFLASAKNIDYNAENGRIEINPSLIVAGADWWLSRTDNGDEGEWWEFNTIPAAPQQTKKVTADRGGAWDYYFA